MPEQIDKAYALGARQAEAFAGFARVGEKNKKDIIEKVVAFLRRELDYEPETGRSLPAVVGVSGGIDSAVVAALAARALGADNVIAVKMPYEGLSAREDTDYADLLAGKFKFGRVLEVPIRSVVEAEVAALAQAGVRLGAFERGNLMARVRMTILYAIANQCGGRVLDTCNLTEVMMGYFTKFGDGASDLNPVGKIYKTWIWTIAEELEVPEEIIRRKPTAGLMSAAQTDEEDMGISYGALDLLLWLKNAGAGKAALVEEYHFSEQVIAMVETAIARNRHKNCLAPVAEIGL